MTRARAKLLDSLNFAPEAGATVPFAIEITDLAGTLDEETLASFDVLFFGLWSQASSQRLTALEQSALQDFVRSGGVVIAECRHHNFDDVCSALGHSTTTGGQASLRPGPGQSTARLFAGPFGSVSSYGPTSAIGRFPANNEASVMAIDSLEQPVMLLEYQEAGTVLLLAEDGSFIDSSLTIGGAIDGDHANDALLGNIFADARTRFGNILRDDFEGADLSRWSSSSP